MALTATIHNFQVQLTDVDRNVYETLSFKIARQVSETEEYFLTRVLAYCLEFTEGLTVSPALADPDEPGLAVRDLTGTLKVWIDIGAPDAARLHKASKAAPRVVVYTHRPPAQIIRALTGEKIHRVEALELYAIDRELLEGLVAHIDRRMTFDLSVTDRHLFVAIAGKTFEGPVERITLPQP